MFNFVNFKFTNTNDKETNDDPSINEVLLGINGSSTIRAILLDELCSRLDLDALHDLRKLQESDKTQFVELLLNLTDQQSLDAALRLWLIDTIKNPSHYPVKS